MNCLKKLLAWLVKPTAYVFAKSPRRLQFFWGQLIGFLWFDVLRIRRNVVLNNLNLAFPHWTEAERLKVARRSMAHLGLTILEFNLFPFFNPKDLERDFEFHGLEHLKAAEEKGKGALILGCHLGNGDLGMMGLAYKGYPVHLISKKFNSKWLSDLWFSLRERHGTRFIEDRKSSFEILKALKKNGRVVFVLDQYTGKPLGMRTQFFGHDTGTAFGLALFAHRTGLAVVPAYSYRDHALKTHVVFEKPLEFKPLDSHDEAMRLNTQIYNDTIESFVKRHPEQWMWVHKRWKTFQD